MLFSRECGYISVRAACPAIDCGLADKSGIKNEYLGDSIRFYCPVHGHFTLGLLDPQGASKLEFNTPMRNLLRNLVFDRDPSGYWIQVIGTDYAGLYQEQLQWRPLYSTLPDILPFIVYSPAILDWSGAKLSKSLYVHKSAYDYLKGTKFEYLLSYNLLKRSNIDIGDVYSVCRN